MPKNTLKSVWCKPQDFKRIFRHFSSLDLKGVNVFLLQREPMLLPYKTRSLTGFCMVATLVLRPAGIYLFKVDNGNTRTRCEICSKLTIKTPERRDWRRSSVCIVNFEHISHLVLVFLLLTLNMQLRLMRKDS